MLSLDKRETQPSMKEIAYKIRWDFFKHLQGTANDIL